VRITPHRAGDSPLNVAVLIDHSGSMGSVCSGQSRGVTTHEAIVSGLKSIAQHLGEADVIDLWEFDDSLAHVGSSHDAAGKSPGKGHWRERLLTLIARLTGPRGGTEIGAALSGTIAASSACDILLITDGKSHALDVQKLARAGRRITVTLVGEDSLEANVGYLAALTGGDILVAAGADIADVLTTAMGTLRASFEQPRPIGASLDRVRVVRGNALLEAEWRPATRPVTDALQARAVAAMAASLALPGLAEERAAQLAEAEGLVTHLTSLVLVDEAGAVHEGIPANRKIALPHPAARSMLVGLAAGMPLASRAVACASPSLDAEIADLSLGESDAFGERAGSADAAFIDLTADLPGIGSRIDWDGSPNRLLAGDLSALDREDYRMITRAAALPEAIALAKQMNIDPVVLIVALIARSQSLVSRSAARIAKAILGGAFTDELRRIAGKLGLELE
jgi:hypothetical protein